MKKAIIYITLADLIFILLLAISGLFSGVAERIVYYIAFAAPFLMTIFIIKKDNIPFYPLKLKMSCKNALLVAPILAPTLLGVFFISWITSLMLTQFGYVNVVDVSGNILYVVLIHAFVPALFEEALFRYIPISCLSPYSKRSAVLISALCFSLVHCNLFQIPYAFTAGVVFAVIDIMCGSILPSFAFHFINNATSVLWLRHADNKYFAIIYLSVLFVLAVASAVPIIIKRKVYKDKLVEIFGDKSKQELSFVLVFFAFATLIMAVMNLK